jgi:hypothetical protein
MTEGCETNEQFARNVSMVDPGLEDGIGDLAARIHDHHSTVALTQDVDVIVNSPEDETTVYITLDVSL